MTLLERRRRRGAVLSSKKRKEDKTKKKSKNWKRTSDLAQLLEFLLGAADIIVGNLVPQKVRTILDLQKDPALFESPPILWRSVRAGG